MIQLKKKNIYIYTLEQKVKIKKKIDHNVLYEYTKFVYYVTYIMDACRRYTVPIYILYR